MTNKIDKLNIDRLDGIKNRLLDEKIYSKCIDNNLKNVKARPALFFDRDGVLINSDSRINEITAIIFTSRNARRITATPLDCKVASRIRNLMDAETSTLERTLSHTIPPEKSLIEFTPDKKED